MDIKITPHLLKGEMDIPPSKSYSHRAFICAFLGGGEAIGVGDSEDIEATRQCLEAIKKNEPLFANESGSTLRFMIPIALAMNKKCTITGSERLMQRPLKDYFDIFDEKGIKYSLEGSTLNVEGELTGGEYRLRGDVSSQFITGLLLALPLTGKDCEIVITTPLESKAYVDMTLSAQKKFGIENIETERGYFIPGGQKYKSASYSVEGDYSQAAFFLSMGDVVLKGLDKTSLQGDREIVDVYRKMGMKIEDVSGGYKTNGRATKNISVDVSQIPDCVPALACLMAVTEGEGRIVNAARLRIKESDRLRAVFEELSALGADIEEGEDFLVIRGKKRLTGGVCNSHNDHRIAMAIASVTPCCDGDVIIKGAECVKKSMPDFWERFVKLGGIADELVLG
jgi:3-phosphoshikimate 1-carboxyvinyltransferase